MIRASTGVDQGVVGLDGCAFEPAKPAATSGHRPIAGRVERGGQRERHGDGDGDRRRPLADRGQSRSTPTTATIRPNSLYVASVIDECHAVRARKRNRDINHTNPAVFDGQDQHDDDGDHDRGSVGSTAEADRQEEADQQDVLEVEQGRGQLRGPRVAWPGSARRRAHRGRA